MRTVSWIVVTMRPPCPRPISTVLAVFLCIHLSVSQSSLDKRGAPGQPLVSVNIQEYCSIAGHDVAVFNGQFYVIGGENEYYGNNNTNNYFNIPVLRYFSIDTTSPFKTSSPTNVNTAQNKTVPSLIPVRNDAITWATQDDIYIYGGSKAILYGGGNSYGYDNASTIPAAMYSLNPTNNNAIQVATKGSSFSGRNAGTATQDEAGVGYYLGGARGRYNDPTIPLDSSNDYPVTGLLSFDTKSKVVSILTTVGLNGNTTWGRGSLDYINIGKKGILVALGGVQWNAMGFNPASTFTPMSNVAMFDIASQQWYHQTANGSQSHSGLPTGGVPVRKNFCTVVTRAPDNSSYHIYMYGGENADSLFETVYVLSLPLFQWSIAAVPKYSIARVAHTCTILDATSRQMLVIGGIMRGINKNYTHTGVYDACRPDLLYQSFDLSTHEWLDTYDPTVKGYELHPSLVSLVGGTAQGGATVKGPMGGYDDANVARIFNYTFPVTTLEVNPTVTSSPSAVPKLSSSSAGASAGGIVGGIVVLAAIVAAVWFIIRRRERRAASTTATEPFLPEPPKDGHGGAPMELQAATNRPTELYAPGGNKYSGRRPVELATAEQAAHVRHVPVSELP